MEGGCLLTWWSCEETSQVHPNQMLKEIGWFDEATSFQTNPKDCFQCYNINN